MSKATAIRIIELDEAIYQLQLILKQEFFVERLTYRYISKKIDELQTKKQKLI